MNYNLTVGISLNDRTIYLNVPDETTITESKNIVTTDKGNYIVEDVSSGVSRGYYSYTDSEENEVIEYFYKSDGTNLESIQLPGDFGVITEVDETATLYEYVGRTSHEKKYVISEDFAKEESMSKNDIEVEIEESVRGHAVPVGSVFGFAGEDEEIPAGYEFTEGETLPYVMDNVAVMKAADLVPGDCVITKGYRSDSDGGQAKYLIREKSVTDSIDEGSIIQLDNETLVAELNEKYNVTPEMFGAYGDGEHDDYQAIQNAINYIIGGSVIFNPKIYLVSNTLVIHRGLKICGTSSYGEENATLKLKDNINKPLLRTPQANGGAATHYMIIENIRFDGNGLNQSEEVNLIEFFGGFIGSMIKNVYISNFFGTGLAIQSCDLQVDHLWIQNGYTLTNRYALHFNPTIQSTDIVSMVNMDHIYVENYRNKTVGNPRTTESDRANGIMAYRVSNLNINELHMEGLKYPVTISGLSVININMVRTAYCGLSTDNDNALIYLLSVPRILYVSNMFSTLNSVYPYWVNRSFSSNDVPTVTKDSVDDDLTLPLYITEQSTTSKPNYIQKSYFSNEVYVNKIGSFSEPKIGIKQSTGTTYLKQVGVKTSIGTNINQTNDKDFIDFTSYGNAGDCVGIKEPLKLATRSTAGSILTDNIYTFDSEYSHFPAYQRVTGNNAGANRIVTTRIGTTSPAETPWYIGEMYLDYTNKKLYIATGTTSASDWTILN